jgi:hypothetical protein
MATGSKIDEQPKRGIAHRGRFLPAEQNLNASLFPGPHKTAASPFRQGSAAVQSNEQVIGIVLAESARSQQKNQAPIDPEAPEVEVRDPAQHWVVARKAVAEEVAVHYAWGRQGKQWSSGRRQNPMAARAAQGLAGRYNRRGRCRGQVELQRLGWEPGRIQTSPLWHR